MTSRCQGNEDIHTVVTWSTTILPARFLLFPFSTSSLSSHSPDSTSTGAADGTSELVEEYVGALRCTMCC
ncbi:hypothetical protein GN956_G24674 [Arapaima gigas]